MNINLRPMTREDKSSVMQILRNTPEFKPCEVDIAEELIDIYLSAPCQSDYHIIVAELDSAIAGYVCFGPTPMTERTWDVYWMAVARDKQSQGIGGALIESAESDIRASAGRLAIIETSSTPAYAKTRRFHTSHGYEIVACIPDFYAPGDSKLILQKRLQ